MSEQFYDVVADDGRILNKHPLNYGEAVLFSCDADIDSTETTSVVPCDRKPKPRTQRSWLWSAVLRFFGCGVSHE